MSWIRSSKGIALVVLFAVAFAAVGQAAAISVTTEQVPEESQVGETVEGTVVIEDPFQDMPETWTLRGETELTNVSWTVTVLQQGNQVDQEVYGEQEFEQELDFDSGGDEIRVEIAGDTPAIENYSYEPREEYVLVGLHEITGNSESELNTTRVHHYTSESKQARENISGAEQAIDESGANGDAQTQLDRAVSAYDEGNFPNANSLAEDARSQAEQSERNQQLMQFALYGVGALVVLALIGAGVYYWRSQQDSYGKLQ